MQGTFKVGEYVVIHSARLRVGKIKEIITMEDYKELAFDEYVLDMLDNGEIYVNLHNILRVATEDEIMMYMLEN